MVLYFRETNSINVLKFSLFGWKFLWTKGSYAFTFHKGSKKPVRFSWDFFSLSIAINQIYHYNGKMSLLLPNSLQRRADVSHQESYLHQIINIFLDIIKFCNMTQQHPSLNITNLYDSRPSNY